jgi:glycosyltransferase involved in cell wall biosynthesis
MGKMITILHTESSEGWGGQEMRIVLESLGMIKRGYRVIIAAPGKSNILHRAKEQGIKVLPFHFQKGNPLALLQMSSLIKKENVNLVNTHSSSDSWVTTIVAKFSKTKPVVIRTRHLSTPISNTYASRLIYNILPAAIVTTGEEIRQKMIHDLRFDGAKIWSIPTGVDGQRFNPEKVNPVLKRSGFVAGMVGVLRSWKGHSYFIEAVSHILKAIPDSRFYIIGDGPQLHKVRNMIRALSLDGKITMLGQREDIPELLASLDVLVHPSTANEGVPQAILQAMAMGKPVVASDVGAIKEVVIHGQTGFLVPPQESQAIAAKVMDLFHDPLLGKKFGDEGRILIQRTYSMERMLDSIEKLYRQFFLETRWR